MLSGLDCYSPIGTRKETETEGPGTTIAGVCYPYPLHMIEVTCQIDNAGWVDYKSIISDLIIRKRIEKCSGRAIF
jgi:hypothetical protein